MSILIRKEACPQCVAEGRDSSADNLAVYDDGHSFCFGGHGLLANGVQEEKGTLQTVEQRGLKARTLVFFNIRTKVAPDGKPLSTGFLWPNGALQIRDWDTKEFRWHLGSPAPVPGLFGMNLFAGGGHRYVTVTEGAYDAASIWQAVYGNSQGTGDDGQGFDNIRPGAAVSVRSASTAVADCVAARSYLDSFERIYLAFDNDPAGRAAVAGVAKLFDYNKVYHVKFSHRKDANEFLQHGEADELKRLWWNSKRYLPETIISSVSEFKKILSKKAAWGVSYPFPTLNQMTYGIRKGEMVLVKAMEKVGKTAFMHHIEYNLLKELPDAKVGSIFIEEPKERHLQQLAGLELQKPVHLPDSGVSQDRIDAAVETVVGSDDRLFIYNHFGTDDPEVLLDTIRFLVSGCGVGYILFDHISMSVSGIKGKESEREALDYITTRLAMMCKELDFALIVVSHINEDGTTRGSRWLTKTADITIHLERNSNAEDPSERTRLHLSVPYNRYCYHTGPAGTLVFNPLTYVLSEGENYAHDNDNTRRDKRLVV